MTTIQFAGNATHDAIVVYPDTPKILKFNIAARILATEADTTPGPFTAIDLDAPLDERITWAEESDDEGLTITGTLEV